MHSLRRSLLFVSRNVRRCQHSETDQSSGIKSTAPALYRGFSSREDDGDGFRGQRNSDFDDKTNDEFWDGPHSDRKDPGFRRSFSGQRRPYRRHHDDFHFRQSSNFGQSRRQFDEADPYGEEFSDDEPFHNRRSGFGSDRQSRFDSRELGSRIKKREWDTGQLPALEKNFYVAHPSVAGRSEADIEAFYKKYNITVTRGERPIPLSDFHEANFPEEINKQLSKNGWTQPTPIQSLGWPLALSGENMVGIAQTGSGKTLGFILPALIHIKHQRRIARGEGPVVLVLAPTRELAQQIKSVAVMYGRLLGVRSCAIFGGQSKLVQARHLSEGPEIVVATPGRLLDFLEMDVVNLDRTSYVVLDEADRMLDMGFEPQIRKVLGQIRPDRQMLMWSATWPREIQQLAHDFLGKFTQVNIGSVELMANPNIEQIVHVCERGEKFSFMVQELQKRSEEGPQKTLIFAQTKTQADFITHRLRKMRFRALAIHGDKTQLVRDKTLHSFRTGETEILVATDVASRGLDVNDIQYVINFDYPNTADDYIHRIGRTARASKSGTAITFVTSEDAGKVGDLIKVLKDAGQNIPEDLIELNQLSKKFGSKGPNRSRSSFDPYRNPNRPYRPGFNRRNSW